MQLLFRWPALGAEDLENRLRMSTIAADLWCKRGRTSDKTESDKLSNGSLTMIEKQIKTKDGRNAASPAKASSSGLCIGKADVIVESKASDGGT